VHCAAVAEQLLAADDDLDLEDEVERHVADCGACATLARRLSRLDDVLQSRLFIEPPRDLQLRLVGIANAAARPELGWWERLRAWLVDGLLPIRPNVVIAQSLTALMVVLAGWQVIGWLNNWTPVLGDVPYAMELVASSPAVVYLNGLQGVDVQSLLMWSGVGLVGWMLSESGPIGRSRAVG